MSTKYVCEPEKHKRKLNKYDRYQEQTFIFESMYSCQGLALCRLSCTLFYLIYAVFLKASSYSSGRTRFLVSRNNRLKAYIRCD